MKVEFFSGSSASETNVSDLGNIIKVSNKATPNDTALKLIRLSPAMAQFGVFDFSWV